MKAVLTFLVLLSLGSLKAQVLDSPGSLRAFGSYAHDFPGLNGYSASAEYLFPLSDAWQGRMDLRMTNLSGYPRTSQVNEFTKAKGLGFMLYWIPLQSPSHLLRMGIGYSFGWYQTKRAYPVSLTDSAQGKTTTWYPQEAKGHGSGINLAAEYQYHFPDSQLSLGLRLQVGKTNERTIYVGPVLGWQL